MQLRAWFKSWPVRKELRANKVNRRYLPFIVQKGNDGMSFYLLGRLGTRYYVTNSATLTVGTVVQVPHEKTGAGLTPIWSGLEPDLQVSFMPAAYPEEIRREWAGYRTLQALQEN